jgi:hypothetical protein
MVDHSNVPVDHIPLSRQFSFRKNEYKMPRYFPQKTSLSIKQLLKSSTSLHLLHFTFKQNLQLPKFLQVYLTMRFTFNAVVLFALVAGALAVPFPNAEYVSSSYPIDKSIVAREPEALPEALPEASCGCTGCMPC